MQRTHQVETALERMNDEFSSGHQLQLSDILIIFVPGKTAISLSQSATGNIFENFLEGVPFFVGYGE